MLPEHVKITQEEIAKRRNKWSLIYLDFDDVSQLIFIRVIKKYAKYNPELSEYSHWINTVISNAIRNILRDNHSRWQRPCLAGCIHATGGNHCSFTPSGIQCAECPLYKKWQKSKEDNFNVNQTLALDNHLQEVHSMPSDSVDILDSKKIIDQQMKVKLNRFEYGIYKSIFIDEKDEKKVTDNLKATGCDVQIRKLKEKFVKVAREIIIQEDLGA